MSNKITTTKTENNTGIYTDAETAILDKVQNNLLMMTDNVIKNADPEKHSYKSDLRIVNEVYANITKNVNDAATGRLKHQDNTDREAILASVAETLKMVSANKAKGTVANLELQEDVTDVEVVDGELSIDPEKLELSEFIDD